MITHTMPRALLRALALHAAWMLPAASGGLSTLSAQTPPAHKILWMRQGPDRDSFFVSQGLVQIGDLDKDGVRDLAGSLRDGRTLEGQVWFLSGRDGRVLRRMPLDPAGQNEAPRLFPAGDLDRDSLPDLLMQRFLWPPRYIGMVAVNSGLDGRAIGQLVGPDGNHFGYAMASLGDLDGDEIPEFAVSTPASEHWIDRVSLKGDLRIYSGRTLDLRLLIRPPEHDNLLGHSVAAAGDLDGDGLGDVVAGAPHTCRVDDRFRDCPPMDLGTGLVTAFSGTTGLRLWGVAGEGGQDGFGSSVASLGDVDGDGVPDVVAGADPTWSPGYAKVLSGRTGRELTVLRGEHVNARFGHTVAALGDVDGDGIPDFAVTALAAPSLDGRIPWAGRVYVFSGRDFSRIRILGGAQTSTEFGNLVLGMEDIDGDGFAEIAVSQTSWGSETSRGVVYMFSGAPDGVEARGEPCAPGEAAGPRIGMGLPPRPGAPVAVHLSGAAPTAMGLLLLGASDKQWLGVPLPLDLTPAGLPGCFLYLSPDVVFARPTDATGFATCSIAIPADPALAGATFFAQWCVDPTPSGAPPTFTRALVCRVLPP